MKSLPHSQGSVRTSPLRAYDSPSMGSTRVTSHRLLEIATRFSRGPKKTRPRPCELSTQAPAKIFNPTRRSTHGLGRNPTTVHSPLAIALACNRKGGPKGKWWREKDSNLRRHTPADLQSAPFGHLGISPQSVRLENLSLTKPDARAERLSAPHDPSSSRVKNSHEGRREKWSWVRDSNP
jgi:hypothetical protein